MAYKRIPRVLRTVIQKIEFLRVETEPGPFHGGPVYQIEATINDVPHSFAIVLFGVSGFSLQQRPEVFGSLRNPSGAVATIARRFHDGESLTFPMDLGDIGTT